MSSSVGKQLRMRKILDHDTQRTVMIPMDHGVSNGPLDGIKDLSVAVKNVSSAGANAIVIHKGMVQHVAGNLSPDTALLIHLSAGTTMNPVKNNKVLVCSVPEAIALGADGISIHTNVGAQMEDRMLEDFGKVSEECNAYGMPLLSMIYPRGKDVTNPRDPELVGHAVRLAAELGADIVKTVYTGDIDSFKEVVKGCPVPIIVAGGNKSASDREFLQGIEDAVNAGAAGVSIGRNAFQAEDQAGMVRALRKVVIDRASVKEALREL